MIWKAILLLAGNLKTAQPQEELGREEHECRDYREASGAGRPHNKFDSITA